MVLRFFKVYSTGSFIGSDWISGPKTKDVTIIGWLAFIDARPDSCIVLSTPGGSLHCWSVWLFETYVILQMACETFFLKTVPLLDEGDDVAMVLTPQAFHNLDVDIDIFNHANIHFWE